MATVKKNITGEAVAVNSATDEICVDPNDASLIPNAVSELEPISLGASVVTLDLEQAASYIAAAVPSGTPKILWIKADGAFYWTTDGTTPSATKGDAYEANTRHAIPINGATRIRFLRSGDSTVTIKGKVLLHA